MDNLNVLKKLLTYLNHQLFNHPNKRRGTTNTSEIEKRNVSAAGYIPPPLILPSKSTKEKQPQHQHSILHLRRVLSSAFTLIFYAFTLITTNHNGTSKTSSFIQGTKKKHIIFYKYKVISL